MPVLTRLEKEEKLILKRIEEQEAIPQAVTDRPTVLLSDLWIQTKGQEEVKDASGAVIQKYEPPSLIPFEPNAIQIAFLDELCPLWREGVINPHGLREIILKARQFGFSTLIAAIYFLITVNNTDVNTVVMADEAGNTETLFQKMRIFWEYLPDEKRPRTAGNSTRHLYFPDIRSRISVITAGSRTAGRSRTIHNLHASELPFWPDPSILTGLLQSVPRAGNVFFESTANGEDEVFCAQYRLARDGVTGYTARFFAWWQHDEYEDASASPQFARTDAEVTEANKYSLDVLFGTERTNRKLLWRRKKIAEPGMGTKFAQEYPGNDEEAFLVSGTRFFTEWNEDRHTFVLGSVEIQRHWQRIGGYDWGIGAPACFLLGVVDDRGRVLIIDEVYGANRTDPEQAADVLACLKRHNLQPWQVPIYADPAMWALKRDQTTGVAMANVTAFHAAGLKMVAASNNRLHGWANIKRYLHDDDIEVLKPGTLVNPSVGETNEHRRVTPFLRVAQNCANLIRVFPLQIRAKTNPEDCETAKIEDHPTDTLRYLLSSHPRPSSTEPPVPKIDYSKQPLYYGKWRSKNRNQRKI